MNWSCWTWVLYSATIVATSHALSSWDALLRAYGDGIARSRKRKQQRLPQRGRAHVVEISMPRPEGFWRITGLTLVLCTAPDTDSAWRCTKTRAWPADRSTFWFRGT